MDNAEKQPSESLQEASLAEQIVHLCQDQGITRILRFSCSAQTALADEIIIAIVRSERMLDATTEKFRLHLKQTHNFLSREIPRHDKSGWVVVDFGAIILHLMNEKNYMYYRLDELYTPVSTPS